MLRLYIILCIFTLNSTACMRFRMSDKRILKKFKHSSYKPEIKRYKVEGRNIRYIEVGNKSKPMIIFVHGAPGSSQDFYKYLQDSTLLQKARMIAVDRPGYGYSDFSQSLTSIETQAKLLKPILEINQHSQKPLLVGYSFGGPVVARMAMDFPKLTGSLLMLAPAIDPENEKMFWINKPVDKKAFRWLVPKVFRVANDEKMTHVAELKQMKNLWKNISNKTVFMHGYSDKIVDIINSKFGVKSLINAPVDTVFQEDMSHTLVWKKYDLVKQELIKLLEE